MVSEIIVQVLNDQWKRSFKPHVKQARAAVEAALPASKGAVDITLVLADDAFVTQLNHQFRGKNKPTNVLSFPNDDAPLGDIILAYETIAREAEEQHKTFAAHATHLIVHGVLHLLGHDHEAPEEAKKMEAREVKILKKLGFANPYLPSGL